MQSNASIQGIEYVRNGWSAEVEGLPLVLGVGMIVQIDAGGLLSLTVPGAPMHDHASPAQGDILRPRILNVGVPAASGIQDIFLWRDTDGSLTIAKDAANAPMVGLNLRTSRLNVTPSGGTLWATGSSTFPTAPSTNDLYYRTDLAGWYFWNGTGWYSTEMYTATIPVWQTLPPLGATVIALLGAVPKIAGQTLWLDSLMFATEVTGTNTAGNTWSIQATADTEGALGAAFSVLGDGATPTSHVVTVGANVTGARWYATATKSGAAGVLNSIACVARYRMLAT